MQRFEEKVVLITGAASGIGRACALRLAEEGARLALSDIQAEALEGVAKEARERGAEVDTRRLDVADEAQVRAAVAAAVDRFGRLDVACNVAGILRFDHTHELALAGWSRLLAVNLTGTFLVCREALPHLLATRGNVVNVASTAGMRGHPWTAAYSASKGGMIALTATIAVEYSKQGVRANAICPGSIETPITQAFRIPEGADPKLVRRMMPLTGFAGPEKVASAVAFVASEEGSHITGETIRIDGGALS
ncbi:MAG: SDR family NAD(P)-dependent oxidoreductase [Deltaproteobacteria bacterium]|nr:SDR family NAD(P)-dependent oxidoreductase [Deltaproteobacteria bacterium]